MCQAQFEVEVMSELEIKEFNERKELKDVNCNDGIRSIRHGEINESTQYECRKYATHSINSKATPF